MALIRNYDADEARPFAVTISGRYVHSVSKYEVRVTNENFMRFATIQGAESMAKAVRDLHGFEAKVEVVDEG